MNDALYSRYERELLYLRQYSEAFSRQYPATAGRLLLDANQTADPHVERMIESVALLTARVHHKLDDDFPELTESLLSVLYPHYLAPIPSLATVQFDADPARIQSKSGFQIERNSRLSTQRVGDIPCRYRTCFPVTLWPIQVVDAEVVVPPFPRTWQPPARSAAAIRVRLEAQGDHKFSELTVDRLRFFLFGSGQMVANLYEILFNAVTQVVYRPTEASSKIAPIIREPADCLSQAGFADDEALLPYPSHAQPGYRLLTEFFAYPSKFCFVDFTNLKPVLSAGFNRQLEIVLFTSRSSDIVEQGVDDGTFRLGVTPAANLFERVAEPIHLNQAHFEYRVLPDAANPAGMEVYSVDEVTGTDPDSGEKTTYHPFYTTAHDGPARLKGTLWCASRKPSSVEGDGGSDMYLSLVDLAFSPNVNPNEVLIAKTTCTNRELPRQLHLAGDKVRFELEAAAPISRIRCLKPPTPPIRPAGKRGAHWRLVSHLNLNYLSLADPDRGREILQEILRLYDFSDSSSGKAQSGVANQIIDGMLSLRSRRVVAQTGSETSSGFCRGMEIEIVFDEDKYVGTGVFLFASVLERFLGLYASINSFTQLVARTKQSEGVLKRWPPRAGEQELI